MIALLLPIPQVANADSVAPKVLVTASPLQPIADALLEGITHAAVLTRPGQDAHIMSLAPRQAQAIEQADIIIMPDKTMNPIVAQLAARRKNVTLIALVGLKGAKPLAYRGHQPWVAEEEEEETSDEPLYDPHLWLDPLRMAALAEPLAEAMAQQNPGLRGQLLANAARLRAHLQEVDRGLKALVEARKAKTRYDSKDYIPFVTGHDAYRYFAQRYQLPDNGALISRPEDYLGARSNHDMLKRAGEVTIGCVIAEQATPMVKRVAAASEARIVILSPENFVARDSVPPLPWIENDYDRLLYATAKNFRDCLEK